jgi:uncharacterized protein
LALFHDARRINDGWDPGHGAWGAALVRGLRDSLPLLTVRQVELLCEACAHHTDGRIHEDSTVGVCWDADQLDLWRVGTPPLKGLLSTETARSRGVMAWARARGRGRVVPAFVWAEWMEASSP